LQRSYSWRRCLSQINRIVDRDKLRKSNQEFFRRFVELLEGYFEGVKVKPVLLCIADNKKSILAFKEGDELVAVTITIPLVVLLQKAMFEALWRQYSTSLKDE